MLLLIVSEAVEIETLISVVRYFSGHSVVH